MTLLPLIRTLLQEFSCLKKVLIIGEAFGGAEKFDEFVYQPRPDRDAELSQRASEVLDSDPTLLLYTSGSTGKPKGVIHTHNSIVENIKVEVKKFFFDEQSRALIHFPINHVASVVELGFAAILAGGFIVCMDRFDPAESLRVIPKERLTALGTGPCDVSAPVQRSAVRSDRPQQHQAVCMGWRGSPQGSWCKCSLEICSKTGAVMITGYGSTEVCGFVTYTEKGDSPEKLLHTAGKNRRAF